MASHRQNLRVTLYSYQRRPTFRRMYLNDSDCEHDDDLHQRPVEDQLEVGLCHTAVSRLEHAQLVLHVAGLQQLLADPANGVLTGTTGGGDGQRYIQVQTGTYRYQ